MLVSPRFDMQRSVGAGPSMLFDMEDEADEEASADFKSSQVASRQAKQLVQAAASSVGQLMQLVQLVQQDDLVSAAQALGFTVRLRDCVGGGQGAACLQNLRHSFLILSPSAHSSCSVPHSEEIIIDPTFREQFVIAHPSSRYLSVLEALPPVFIGTPSTVQPLVEFLCSEMSLAFAAGGIVMPPWRSLRSMMTKWMPRRSLDLPLSTAAAAGLTGCPAAMPGLLRSGAAAAALGATNTGSSMRINSSTQLLRRACIAAVGEGSAAVSCATATTMRSASSSNSSSGARHAPVLHATGCSEGWCDSAGASPAALQRRDPAAAMQEPTTAGDSTPQPVGAPTTVARLGVKCFEPLQRFVGGFGFGATPT